MYEKRNLFLFLIEINNMHRTRHILPIPRTCIWRVWLFTAPDRTGQHWTAPDHIAPTPDRTGPVPSRKWLIISLRRLLRVELRHNSEPMVLGLQLNKQETLNTSVTNSSRASIGTLLL